MAVRLGMDLLLSASFAAQSPSADVLPAVETKILSEWAKSNAVNKIVPDIRNTLPSFDRDKIDKIKFEFQSRLYEKGGVCSEMSTIAAYQPETNTIALCSGNFYYVRFFASEIAAELFFSKEYGAKIDVFQYGRQIRDVFLTFRSSKDYWDPEKIIPLPCGIVYYAYLKYNKYSLSKCETFYKDENFSKWRLIKKDLYDTATVESVSTELEYPKGLSSQEIIYRYKLDYVNAFLSDLLVFSIAHEIGHALGDNEVGAGPCHKISMERNADQFAFRVLEKVGAGSKDEMLAGMYIWAVFDASFSTRAGRTLESYASETEDMIVYDRGTAGLQTYLRALPEMLPSLPPQLADKVARLMSDPDARAVSTIETYKQCE